MDNNIVDLDVLIPEDQPPIKFTGRQDKKEYIVDLWIPAAVGLLIIDNIETIMGIFPKKEGDKPKVDESAIDIVLKIFALMCREKYPHIDVVWIRKNISLLKLGVIATKMMVSN
jgi:hypothetical protein